MYGNFELISDLIDQLDHSQGKTFSAFPKNIKTFREFTINNFNV